MIEVLKLRRSFGDFSLAVDELRIDSGRYGVILGPSGSGKSLLLKVICGLLRPDSGQIRVAGKNVTGLPAESRGVGLVFQESSLFPHYSVHDNIAFGPRVTGQDRQIVDQLVESLRLTDILKRAVGSLSGGEIQKVSLARALAVRPRVLLLDEPLSQVDHNSRLELQAELQRIHREMKLTTLHVTHNREEAFSLAETCAVLLGGRLLQCGPQDRIREQPACRFVARFLGLPEAAELEPPPGCTEKCLEGTGLCNGR